MAEMMLVNCTLASNAARFSDHLIAPFEIMILGSIVNNISSAARIHWRLENTPWVYMDVFKRLDGAHQDPKPHTVLRWLI